MSECIIDGERLDHRTFPAGSSQRWKTAHLPLGKRLNLTSQHWPERALAMAGLPAAPDNFDSRKRQAELTLCLGGGAI